jgi:hypothetical protein
VFTQGRLDPDSAAGTAASLAEMVHELPLVAVQRHALDPAAAERERAAPPSKKSDGASAWWLVGCLAVVVGVSALVVGIFMALYGPSTASLAIAGTGLAITVAVLMMASRSGRTKGSGSQQQ